MDWPQTITLLGVIIACCGGIIAVVIWSVTKLDSDIKSIGTRVDGYATRMDGHAARIDQLYTMFVDLVKERKK
jgi:hypothetical protein